MPADLSTPTPASTGGFDPDAYLAKKARGSTAKYRVTSPEGHVYNVTGPAGATDDEVIAQVKAASGPWEKYQTPPPADGPWTKYQNAPAGGGFDPDAYLAKHSKPFDPDAYLASRGAAAPKPPEEPRTAWQNVKDALATPRDVMLSAASGAVAAPIANVAGLAATGYEALTHGSRGDGDMPSRFRDDVRERLTYHPDNHLLREAGRVAAPVVGGVGEFAGRVTAPAVGALRGDAPANSVRGMAANALVEGVKQAPNFLGLYGAQQVPRIVAAAERGAGTLTGSAARAAKSEAMTATRGALGEVEQSHAAAHSARMTEAQAYEDAASRTQSQLSAAAQRTGTPMVDVIGTQVRDEYLNVISDAKAARAKQVEPLYAKAKAAAAAREAQGQFVDVKPALKDLDQMIEDSKQVPDLHAKLLRLRQSVEGVPTKGGAPAPIRLVDSSGRPMGAPITPGATSRPLSYAQLDESARYIKDIAFSGEAEGYGALIRNTAKRLSVKLDEQISKAVPEHAEATAKYRELSEPMETLSTRVGSALHDTEGGLRGDAYDKVSTQDLPGRIFTRKDRVEQLVDSLAGGKNATPQARAAAQAKVDTWVENWVLDQTRGSVGAEAAKGIAAPGMRATLNAAPGARERLVATFGREQAAAVRVPELGKAADAARAEAHASQTQRIKVRAAIEQADADLAHGSRDAAYRGYVSALRQSMSTADPAKYRAAITLIERAGTLEAKTAKAQKLARHFAYGATAAAGFNEGRKLLQ